MPQEYIIYCDESEEKGSHFSNFYGGALLKSVHLLNIQETLQKKKEELNLFGEVKWNKITENYADKYIALIDVFFDFIAFGMIKVRIMFTQNTIVAKNLSERHIDEKYFILYYQFIKHAFGLRYMQNLSGGNIVRIYLDKLPDTKEAVWKFKSFLTILSKTREFREAGVSITWENITEVTSHFHDVLQCLDIVLGAIHFKLNDKHRYIEKGRKRRGKRTKAKERVFKHISKRIRAIYPNFNVGTSTSHGDNEANRLHHAYRHWRFIPRERIVLAGSKRDKKGPGGP
jgi:hypothetical protein